MLFYVLLHNLGNKLMSLAVIEISVVRLKIENGNLAIFCTYFPREKGKWLYFILLFKALLSRRIKIVSIHKQVV